MIKLSFLGLVFGIFCHGDVLAQSSAGRTVYITIDDGPLSGFDNVFETLESEGVQATMFLVGQHVLASDSHQHDLQQAIDRPHVMVGKHSYSHAHERYQHFYSDASGVLSDMQKNNRILGLTVQPFYSRLPGRDVFRTPGLNFDDPFISSKERGIERADYDLLAESGFFLYGWDLEWSHETNGRPVQSVSQLMQQIHDRFESGGTKVPGHLILLAHDQMFSDHQNGRESFTELVQSLKSAGYRLTTLDNYPTNQN